MRAEVDEVLGKEHIKFEHLSKLHYITAVLRETLRITPSVPVFTIEAFEDTTIHCRGKSYKIPKGVGTQILVPQLHRDTKVWGEDVSAPFLTQIESATIDRMPDFFLGLKADVFRPERMLDGGFENAPVHHLVFLMMRLLDMPMLAT